MKKNKIYITSNKYDSFHSLWLERGKARFACVWDTDNLEFDIDEVQQIVELGCVAFISVGKDADKLHDIVDSIVDEINYKTNPDFDIDTRGGKTTNYSLEEAIYEAENNMFPDVDIQFIDLYVFTTQK